MYTCMSGLRVRSWLTHGLPPWRPALRWSNRTTAEDHRAPGIVRKEMKGNLESSWPNMVLKHISIPARRLHLVATWGAQGQTCRRHACVVSVGMPTSGESSTCRPPSAFISLRRSVSPLFPSSHPKHPSSLLHISIHGGTLLSGGRVSGWVGGWRGVT